MTVDRPSWDETWLCVADDVSRRSLCVRDQVGAVVTDRRNRIVATGYNGPPERFDHGEEPCVTWCARAQSVGVADQQTLPRDYSDCPSNHAEANALNVCDRSVREGGTIYVTSHVCFTCAKQIAGSGLAHVVVRPKDDDAAHRRPETGYAILKRCGITVEIL